MAKNGTAAPTQTEKPKVQLPENLNFAAAGDEFQPVSTKAAANPVMQSLLNADIDSWYLFPQEANDDPAVKSAIEGRLRSAAQTLRLGMSMRQDTQGRWAWKVTGPVKPRPRKPVSA